MSVQGIGQLLLIAWGVTEIGLILFKRSPKGTQQTVRTDRKSLPLLWIALSLGVTVGVFAGITRVVGSIHGLESWLGIAGIALLLGGAFLRWWAILTLRHSFTVDVAVHTGQQVITHGPYRLIRHPAYTGALLGFLSFGLIFENWFTLLVVVLTTVPAFINRIRIEEKVLISHFGVQYRSYMARTNRLLPGIW